MIALDEGKLNDGGRGDNMANFTVTAKLRERIVKFRFGDVER